jgi:hypothetical protein
MTTRSTPRLLHFRSGCGNVSLDLIRRDSLRDARLDAGDKLIETRTPVVVIGESLRKIGIDGPADQIGHAQTLFRREVLEDAQLIVLKVDIRPLHRTLPLLV